MVGWAGVTGCPRFDQDQRGVGDTAPQYGLDPARIGMYQDLTLGELFDRENGLYPWSLPPPVRSEWPARIAAGLVAG